MIKDCSRTYLVLGSQGDDKNQYVICLISAKDPRSGRLCGQLALANMIGSLTPSGDLTSKYEHRKDANSLPTISPFMSLREL